MNKRMHINLEEYRDKRKSLRHNLEGEIRTRLLPYIFEIRSFQDLLYESLRLFKQTRRNVLNKEDSIKINIDKVLSYLNISKQKATIRNLTTGQEIESKAFNPIESYSEWILGFEKAPFEILSKLKPRVEKHLKQINELIKFYEQIPEVIKFNEKGETRPDHMNKTILDFYKRGLSERQKIIDYFLTGIYERCIQKATYKPKHIISADLFTDMYDYPYELGKGITGKTLDYRRIDCSSHRLKILYLDEVTKYQKLYKENKVKFYREVFRQRSRDEIFQSIEFNMVHVPLSTDRNPTFKELKRLFKSKQWLAFYALALPQVEGLFTEMVKAINQKSNYRNSLPTKVNLIRNYHLQYESFLDYYEYILPIERNSFTHTGLTNEDFKLKAFDLLTDLENVLGIFAGLNVPLVQLTKLLKSRDFMNFTNIREFNNYFNLLGNISSEQFGVYEGEIQLFNLDFLINSCSLEYLLQESLIEFDDLSSRVMFIFFDYFDSSSPFHFIDKVNRNQISQKLKEQKTLDILSNMFAQDGESFQRLIDNSNFLYNIQKFYSSNNISNYNLIHEQLKKNHRLIQNFSVIFSEFVNLE